MRTYFLLRLLTITHFCFAQNKSVKEDSAYLIYQKQLASLMVTRGMNSSEIDSVLKLYNTNHITSDQNFAQLLGALYPTGKGIGIIFYFFNNDTLKRTLFKPGEVVETKSFRITKEEVLKLNNELVSSLRLNHYSSNRMPHLRGSEVMDEEKTNLSFNDMVAKVSSILLPKDLDENFKHLIFIPTLNIGVVPFHLLKPYKDSLCLIDRCSFSVAPSLLDVIGLRSRTLKKRGVMVDDIVSGKLTIDWSEKHLALPFRSKKTLLVSNPSYPVDGKYIFPDLPGAKSEIDSALPYVGSYKLFSGTNAVKDSIIYYMNGVDLAYFATHGVANGEQPMEKSYLVLSGSSPYLTAKELMDLRFRQDFEFPELVILSACQTGLGKFMEAGVAGLARPFLIGGSTNVIMSLWSVDDKATAYLMNRFVYYLRRPFHFMPAEQLRRAILDTREKYPDPALWASFSVFGVNY